MERMIDKLEFHRAKVICKDGTVHVGTADLVYDASEGNGQELEALLFHDDDGTAHGILETEIERYEILDETA